jgi:hypothetical protein
MANVDLLRKLIREEVRAVFQEELAGILKEAVMEKRSVKTITEVEKLKKPTVPGTLNSQPFRPVMAPNLGAGNPLNSLLAETAQAMSAEEYSGFNYDSTDAQGFGYGQQREVAVVDSVGGMFASARGSSNLDAIQINAVPDYTGLMSKLRANGEI